MVSKADISIFRQRSWAFCPMKKSWYMMMVMMMMRCRYQYGNASLLTR